MNITNEELLSYQKELENKTAQEVLEWSLDFFGLDKIAVASSLGAEDQVLTQMVAEINNKAQVFSLDTGRLPQETYDVLDKTGKKYNLAIEVLFPESSAVESMVKEKGINLFYDSIDSRKECCGIRKVQPLRKKLSQLDAWVTGLRKEQAVTRSNTHKIEFDEGNNLIKINPLADWTEKQTWDYIKENEIPYNKLHDQNFPSIGCAPCTRAIEPHEDVRAGRWWWEEPEQKECGLHWKDGKLVRTKDL